MATYVQQLTSQEVLEKMRHLAEHQLQLPLETALAKLDSGELDELAVSSQLRMLRFLLEETQPEYRQAAE